MTEKKGMSINQRTAVILGVVVIVALVGAVWYFNQPAAGKTQLIVSTTTSFYETGFLDTLKKAFETKYPQYNVSISQGTGLAWGPPPGRCRLVLVHAPSEDFLTNGTGVNRKIVAYNYFLLVGRLPSRDKGPEYCHDALRRLSPRAGRARLYGSVGATSRNNTKDRSLQARRLRHSGAC
jgi:tungstate transport system substrate-binding protein